MFFCVVGVPLFSAHADLLALRNLPFATWEKARLHSSRVLQKVSFTFDVSGVRGRTHDRLQNMTRTMSFIYCVSLQWTRPRKGDTSKEVGI